jgi:ABC-type uncharacterized transport system permease subunit
VAGMTEKQKGPDDTGRQAEEHENAFEELNEAYNRADEDAFDLDKYVPSYMREILKVFIPLSFVAGIPLNFILKYWPGFILSVIGTAVCFFWYLRGVWRAK